MAEEAALADRIEMMLARRADVFRMVAARRRLMLASTMVVVSAAGPALALSMDGPRWVPTEVVLVAAVACYVWCAIEAVVLQRAMRESRMVQACVLLGMLMPMAAPFLLLVLLVESRDVEKIARRIRSRQCGRCGYDVRGITSVVCPECGWEMARLLR